MRVPVAQASSWVIYRLDTGKAVFETFSRDTAESADRSIYGVKTISEWLTSLNEKDGEL